MRASQHNVRTLDPFKRASRQSLEEMPASALLSSQDKQLAGIRQEYEKLPGQIHAIDSLARGIPVETCDRTNETSRSAKPPLVESHKTHLFKEFKVYKLGSR